MSIHTSGLLRHQYYLAKQVTNFCINKLCPRLKNKLDITIEGYWCGDFGCCEDIDTDSKLPREFIISIRKDLTEKEFITTLCHEMVHVQQLAQGKWKPLSNGQHRWYKSYYSNDINYYEQPWEIDAYDKEEQLANEFISLNQKMLSPT